YGARSSFGRLYAAMTWLNASESRSTAAVKNWRSCSKLVGSNLARRVTIAPSAADIAAAAADALPPPGVPVGAPSPSPNSRSRRTQELRKPAPRRQCFGDPVSQHQLGTEILEPQEIFGREFDRLLRNQADNLTPHNAHAVTFRLATHRLEDQVHRRLLEIRQV